jgi:peptide/nickel transport system permease protein
MVTYIARRMFHAALLVFITITATFFILHFAPGDPLNRYFSPGIDPQVMGAVRERLGLDQSLPVQYARWIVSFLRGDYGISIAEHRPVAELLKEAIPRTLQLTVLALAVEIVLGLLLGMLAAMRRHGLRDRVLSIAFLLLYSIPSFYLAYLLITFFSLKFTLLPTSGMTSVQAQSAGWFAAAGDRIAHLILPVFVLGFGSAAGLARYMRGSMLDAVGQEYIRTARAKGLKENRIYWLHALKNALPPVLTVVGLSFPFLLGGSVIIEKIFAWPGMGSLMVDSIFARDYPVVLAANVIGACMVIAGSMLADIACAVVDPRIRTAYTGADS